MPAVQRRRNSRAAVLSALAALAGLGLLLTAIEAHRLDLLATATMAVFAGLGVALGICALAFAMLGILSIWRYGRAGGRMVALGLGGGALLLAVPLAIAWWVAEVPALPDVSTDWADPPPLRFGGFAPTTPALAAARAARQAAAYPEIAPRRYRADVPAVFAAARKVAAANGWQVLDLALPVGRGASAWLEAVDRHSIFALRDEIALRVSAEVDGARLDIRSAARFGGHDFGSNAARVRAVLADLDKALAPGG